MHQLILQGPWTVPLSESLYCQKLCPVCMCAGMSGLAAVVPISSAELAAQRKW